MLRIKLLSILFLVAFVPAQLSAQDHKAAVSDYIDGNAGAYSEIAQEIWDLAEVGYLETQSSALLAQT